MASKWCEMDFATIHGMSVTHRLPSFPTQKQNRSQNYGVDAFADQARPASTKSISAAQRGAVHKETLAGGPKGSLPSWWCQRQTN